MTRIVHILSDGFHAPNARAFIFPVIKHKRAIEAQGVRLRIFSAEDGDLTHCDNLLVDSRYFSGNIRGASDYIERCLSGWKENLDSIDWYDTTDSAGRLHGLVFPYIRRYLKNQILADKSLYLKTLYGRRLFSDYYHREWGIEDNDAEEPDDNYPQLTDPADLEKISLSWNSGLSDYSFSSPYRAALFEQFPSLNWFLSYPSSFTAHDRHRSRSLSCRMSTNYRRLSVSVQRQRVTEAFSERVPSGRVSRRQFFRELASSKIVASPFGWGEINYRDYETFLAGAMLFKPDMSHMETWPAFFERDITYGSFSWDLSDLMDKLDHYLSDDTLRIRIAQEAQRRYRQFLLGPAAADGFAKRFASLLDPVVSK